MSRRSVHRLAALSISVLGLAVLGLAVAAASAHAQAPSVRLGALRGSGAGYLRRELPAALEAAGVAVRDDAPTELSGRVSRRRGRRSLALTLTAGERTEALTVREREPRRLVRAGAQAVAERLRSMGDPALPPEAPSGPPRESSTSATPRATPTSEPPREGGRASAPSQNPHATILGRDAALELSAGLSWMARRLSFSDDIFDRVGEYELPAAPVITAGATWFPARHWTSHALAGFGVTGRFFGAFAVSSATADGAQRFETTIDDFAFGLVYRARAHELLRVEGELDYGESRFGVEPAGPARPGSRGQPIPSTRYAFVRPAAALFLDLPEGFTVRAGVGWRAVVDSGALAYDEWFPGSSSTGVDVSLSLTWRFSPWFAARIRAEHIRYLTAIDAQPGDALVAGGAADEWTSAGAELLAILPEIR